MKRTAIIAALAAVVVLVAGMVAQARSPHQRATRATTLTVIEHSTTSKVVDVGKKGDSTGDIDTFHDQIYDATDTTVAGDIQGQCIRIAPKQGSWECAWTTFVDDGSLTVEGPFYDTKDSVLAITGGTGAYAAASGEMQLVSMNGGTEYKFVFSLT